MLSAAQRACWQVYWEEDLLPLRASYPELAHWDDHALIVALTDFGKMILGRHQVSTDRDARFLEWVRLSSRQGSLLDQAAFAGASAKVAAA